MTYLARMQITNPESIIKLASGNDTNEMCNMLENNLKDIDNYLATCNPPQQRQLYLQLINGVRGLENSICKNENFKQEFVSHSSCFSNLSEKYSACVGPSDWLEEPDPAQACKTFKDIEDCYFSKTEEMCGHESALVMKTLIKGIINSVLTVDCGTTTFESGLVTSIGITESPESEFVALTETDQENTDIPETNSIIPYVTDSATSEEVNVPQATLEPTPSLAVDGLKSSPGGETDIVTSLEGISFPNASKDDRAVTISENSEDTAISVAISKETIETSFLAVDGTENTPGYGTKTVTSAGGISFPIAPTDDRAVTLSVNSEDTTTFVPISEETLETSPSLAIDGIESINGDGTEIVEGMSISIESTEDQAVTTANNENMTISVAISEGLASPSTESEKNSTSTDVHSEEFKSNETASDITNEVTGTDEINSVAMEKGNFNESSSISVLSILNGRETTLEVKGEESSGVLNITAKNEETASPMVTSEPPTTEIEMFLPHTKGTITDYTATEHEEISYEGSGDQSLSPETKSETSQLSTLISEETSSKGDELTFPPSKDGVPGAESEESMSPGNYQNTTDHPIVKGNETSDILSAEHEDVTSQSTKDEDADVASTFMSEETANSTVQTKESGPLAAKDEISSESKETTSVSEMTANLATESIEHSQSAKGNKETETSAAEDDNIKFSTTKEPGTQDDVLTISIYIFLFLIALCVSCSSCIFVILLFNVIADNLPQRK